MLSLHSHLFDSWSILGLVGGVVALPVAVLGLLFFVARMFAGG